MQRIRSETMTRDELRERMERFASLDMDLSPEESTRLANWIEDYMDELGKRNRRGEDPRQMRLFD